MLDDLRCDRGDPDEDVAESGDAGAVEQRPAHLDADGDHGDGAAQAGQQQGARCHQRRRHDRSVPTDPCGEEQLKTAGFLVLARAPGRERDRHQRDGETENEAELVGDHTTQGADAGDLAVEHQHGVAADALGIPAQFGGGVVEGGDRSGRHRHHRHQRDQPDHPDRQHLPPGAQIDAGHRRQPVQTQRAHRDAPCPAVDRLSATALPLCGSAGDACVAAVSPE